MQKKDRLGETIMSNCGQMMTIVRYKDVHDIDVEFEDGSIVTNRSYKSFKKGQIKPPVKRVGESIKSTCGQLMTIIKDNGAYDIDVKFEDGTIVTHKTYKNFKVGYIKNPNYDEFEGRVGETSTSTCGQMMTIIKYNSSSDVNVRFEDGTVVEGKLYRDFQKGKIKNPNYDEFESRKGESKMSTCGQMMTIIKYNSSSDIDVRFEDGTVVTEKSYSSFRKGQIKNPNNRLGEKGFATCGESMSIIRYNSVHDVDIEFEDGTIVKNRSYKNFKKGRISHPKLSTSKRCVYKNIHATYAWTEEDKVYYVCKCQKCGEENIWTPQDMIAHEKKCRGESV